MDRKLKPWIGAAVLRVMQVKIDLLLPGLDHPDVGGPDRPRPRGRGRRYPDRGGPSR